jgi:hypothetical protein
MAAYIGVRAVYFFSGLDQNEDLYTFYGGKSNALVLMVYQRVHNDRFNGNDVLP